MHFRFCWASICRLSGIYLLRRLVLFSLLNSLWWQYFLPLQANIPIESNLKNFLQPAWLCLLQGYLYSVLFSSMNNFHTRTTRLEMVFISCDLWRSRTDTYAPVFWRLLNHYWQQCACEFPSWKEHNHTTHVPMYWSCSCSTKREKQNNTLNPAV